MELNELQVDVHELVQRAHRAGWGRKAITTVWAMAGQPVPAGHEEWARLPLETVGYVALSRSLDGYMRLAAVDSLVGVDGVKTGGAVLLAMAQRIFLPHVPAEHAARQPTEALLAAFSGWLLDGEPAEKYLAEAYRYRSRFGTTCTAIGTDRAHEELFDAMPSGGLDHALGEGHWSLSCHWRGFGRFLAAQVADWKALEVLADEAHGIELVADDEHSDEEAHDALDGLIDAQRDRCIEVALAPHDGALRELVDGMLVTLCRAPAGEQA